MKRKITLLLVSIILVLSFTVSSFAVSENEQVEPETNIADVIEGTTDIDENENEIVPYYMAVGSASAGFSISSKGVATCLAQVTAKSSSSMNAAKVTIQIKKSNGTVVKTWTKAQMSKSANTYRTTLSYTLSRGTYYMTATIYCYQNSKMVEDISKKTVNKTY